MHRVAKPRVPRGINPLLRRRKRMTQRTRRVAKPRGPHGINPLLRRRRRMTRRTHCAAVARARPVSLRSSTCPTRIHVRLVPKTLGSRDTGISIEDDPRSYWLVNVNSSFR